MTSTASVCLAVELNANVVMFERFNVIRIPRLNVRRWCAKFEVFPRES